jgi:hypothetical protein
MKKPFSWVYPLSEFFQKFLSFCKSHTVFSLFIIFIVGLNTLARFPIRIINAVTLDVDPDFAVQVSWLRKLIEPFVGFQLFSIRAGDPLIEYIALWVWLFLIFGILLVSKQSKQFIKYWVLSVPAVIGLAYLIIIWMIFWPLPANTIVNNSQDTILFNTHAHSHFSHDGLITPEEQMAWHERNGFDAFFLTEHNHNSKTLELVQRQQRGDIPHYPHIMSAIEFSGSNHMVLLGLTDSLITFGKKDALVIKETHRQGGLIGLAHWFDGRHNSLEHYVNLGIDGFEIVNRNQIAYPIETHEKIVKMCSENQLFIIGGADYHGYGPTCKTWNAMAITGWNELDHSARTAKIMTGLSAGKNQVLYYSDRRIYGTGNIWLSPLKNIVDYFRSLNGFQVLSWVVWCLLFIVFKVIYSAKCFYLIPFVSGIAILVQGRVLLEKSINVMQYNDILLEFGNLFTLHGIGLIGSGILIYLILKRFPKLIN